MTGEADCGSHVAVDELHCAIAAAGNVREQGTLDELIEQDRLRPLDVLPEVLALTQPSAPIRRLWPPAVAEEALPPSPFSGRG